MSTQSITPQVGKQQYTLIQSYVLEKFFVSTIYRQSSVNGHDLWYYETCLFEWDSKTRKTGSLIDTYESGITEYDAIDNHLVVCKVNSLRNEP